MLKATMPFSKEIKKDYNIDPTADIADTEKMEQLGIKMGNSHGGRMSGRVFKK
ncbi:hypothetical protein [Chryseobacterium indoltheticum]|uniref:hypothetical protein n=1 Tax=Chryseobacterium indoltheticum TaxID=254 RepID=UPI003F497BCD